MDPLVDLLLLAALLLILMHFPVDLLLLADRRVALLLILMHLPVDLLLQVDPLVLQVDLLPPILVSLDLLLLAALQVDPLVLQVDLLPMLVFLVDPLQVDLLLITRMSIRTRTRTIKTRSTRTRTRKKISTRTDILLMHRLVFLLLMLVLQLVFPRQDHLLMLLLQQLVFPLQVHILLVENHLRSIRTRSMNTRRKVKPVNIRIRSMNTRKVKLVRKAIRRRRARRSIRRRRRSTIRRRRSIIRSIRNIVSIRSIISTMMKMRKDWAKRTNSMNIIIFVTGRSTVMVTAMATATATVGMLALAGMVQVLLVIHNTRDRALVTMGSIMLLPRVDRLLCRFLFLR